MISLLIPTIVLIVIIFIVTVSGGDSKKVINAMKNLGTMSSIDMILTSLIVILFVSWVIIAKINSYYDGMYAFSTEYDREKLKDTVTTAIRMLDNVIDINYYSVPQAKNSNFKHRPIGMGLMGFQDEDFVLICLHYVPFLQRKLGHSQSTNHLSLHSCLDY